MKIGVGPDCPSHPPLIALAITLLVLSGVAVSSGGNLSPGVREDRANRWVIVALGLIELLDAYLPAYTDRKEFWTLDGVGCGQPWEFSVRLLRNVCKSQRQ